MSAAQILGVALLTAVFVGLFAMTVRTDGWAGAVLCWLFASALTGVVTLAAWLIAGGPA